MVKCNCVTRNDYGKKVFLAISVNERLYKVIYLHLNASFKVNQHRSVKWVVGKLTLTRCDRYAQSFCPELNGYTQNAFMKFSWRKNFHLGATLKCNDYNSISS